MKLRHLPSLCAALLALCPTLATAQSTSGVPGLISYQGRVVDAAGANVGAGTPVNRTVIFRIWDNPSSTAAANLIYSEAQTVTVSEGEFSVLVGQGVANPTQTFSYSEADRKLADFGTAFNGSARYLGVTVAAAATIATTDNEITPRQQIVSTAFAMRAKMAEGVVDSKITNTMIGPGAVTVDKIGTGAVTSTQILDATIGTADIADSSITTVDIADNSITTAKIVDSSVVTADLADNSVTSAKIANGAVTGGDIAAATITADNLGANTATTTENLRVVRGTVTRAGAITAGSGFTVGPINSADTQITINFNTAFSGTPTIMISNPIITNERDAGTTVLFSVGRTTSSVKIEGFNTQNLFHRAGFDFIAIGPR